MEDVDCTKRVQDRLEWRDLLSTVMNTWSHNIGEYAYQLSD